MFVFTCGGKENKATLTTPEIMNLKSEGFQREQHKVKSLEMMQYHWLFELKYRDKTKQKLRNASAS